MAIIWSKVKSGVKYEVRQAGASIRLYTDGVFHSQYNEKRFFTGNVWDLLMLPLFWFDALEKPRVLLLGVGGGTLFKHIERIRPGLDMTGVELNPVHLAIAKRFFKVNSASVKLVQADAIEWLKKYRGPAFDLIVDDLFLGKDGDPERAIKTDINWLQKLRKNLSRDGLIVMNFSSAAELRSSALAGAGIKLPKNFSRAVFTHPVCENRVLTLSSRELDAAKLRQRLDEAGFFRCLHRPALHYNVRSI